MQGGAGDCPGEEEVGEGDEAEDVEVVVGECEVVCGGGRGAAEGVEGGLEEVEGGEGGAAAKLWGSVLSFLLCQTDTWARTVNDWNIPPEPGGRPTTLPPPPQGAAQGPRSTPSS